MTFFRFHEYKNDHLFWFSNGLNLDVVFIDISSPQLINEATRDLCNGTDASGKATIGYIALTFSRVHSNSSLTGNTDRLIRESVRGKTINSYVNKNSINVGRNMMPCNASAPMLGRDGSKGRERERERKNKQWAKETRNAQWSDWRIVRLKRIGLQIQIHIHRHLCGRRLYGVNS